MSEIDWSIERLKRDPVYWDKCGAPEDATHVAVTVKGKTWLQADSEGTQRIWHRRFSEWREGMGEHPPIKLIPRPTKPEWVDGVPPVGEECEVDDPALGDWNRCLVEWIGREIVVVDRPEGGELAVLKQSCNFRPIQTPEERQREELVRVISEDEEMLPETIADAILKWMKDNNLTEK